LSSASLRLENIVRMANTDAVQRKVALKPAPLLTISGKQT